MASIETVVQNADAEGDDSKPDSTAESKEEPGKIIFYCLITLCHSKQKLRWFLRITLVLVSTKEMLVSYFWFLPRNN